MKLHDPQGRAAVALAGKTVQKGRDGFFDVPDGLVSAAKKYGLVDAAPFMPKPMPEPEPEPEPQLANLTLATEKHGLVEAAPLMPALVSEAEAETQQVPDPQKKRR